jgi:hypothetical protein
MITNTGEPWCKLVDNLSTENDITKTGAPYCVIGVGIPNLGHIKAVNQVDWAKVKSYMGVNKANIKKISNVEG